MSAAAAVPPSALPTEVQAGEAVGQEASAGAWLLLLAK